MEPAAAAKPPRPPNRHRKRRLGAKPSSGTRRERTDVPGWNRPQRQSRHGLPIGIASDASGRNRAQVRDVSARTYPDRTGRSGKAATASQSASQATPRGETELRYET